MKLQTILIQIVVFSLCVVSSFSIYSEDKMKNNIDLNLNEIVKRVQSFKINPTQEANDANLRNALYLLNNIKISRSEYSLDEFKKYRAESLKLHVEILELFEQFYIENYKPNKPYHINLMPPLNSIDGPVFGAVDPAQIKDPIIRSRYILDVEENNKIGKEIAFQGELKSLKNALVAPDINVGSIATVESFIKKNYDLDTFDESEIREIIFSSELKNNIKNKILSDTIK